METPLYFYVWDLVLRKKVPMTDAAFGDPFKIIMTSTDRKFWHMAKAEEIKTIRENQ